MADLSREEWRPVVGWEGFYEVTVSGHVRSLTRQMRQRSGQSYTVRGRMLRTDISSKGYLCVTLTDSQGGRSVHATIHRLIAEAFVPNPEGLPEVDHIDRNPMNNAISNLRWVTRKGNCRNTRVVKLSERDAERIRMRLAGGATKKSLAQEYGVHPSTIWCIAHGRLWAGEGSPFRREHGRPRKMLEFNGRSQFVSDWAVELGYARTTLRRRVATMPLELALTPAAARLAAKGGDDG